MPSTVMLTGHSARALRWIFKIFFCSAFHKEDLEAFEESQNCRGPKGLLEMVESNHLLRQVPCSRLHRRASRGIFNISREGDPTAPLGSLFQCSATLKVRSSFLCSDGTLCSSSAHCSLSCHWSPPNRASTFLISHSLNIYNHWKDPLSVFCFPG